VSLLRLMRLCEDNETLKLKLKAATLSISIFPDTENKTVRVVLEGSKASDFSFKLESKIELPVEEISDDIDFEVKILDPIVDNMKAQIGRSVSPKFKARLKDELSLEIPALLNLWKKATKDESNS